MQPVLALRSLALRLHTQLCMNMKILKAQPLTAAAFAPFGQVIGLEATTAASAAHCTINGGNAVRYDLVPDMQLTAQGGAPMLALFRAQARTFPLNIGEMERHVLGSQTFIPLGTQCFVLVVAAAGSPCRAEALQAFITNGQQGVMLAPGTWHHALLAVEGGDFAVIERRAALVDCEVQAMPAGLQLHL